jgi:type II secretory pathway component GspD/PulD (secretin)
MINRKFQVSGYRFLAVVLLLVLLGGGVLAAKESVNISVQKGKVYLNLKDADIKSVLQIFAKATGANIIASDDVTGKITVTFTGIDPREGLEAVLRTKGLDWFEEAGTIFISTKKIMRTYYLENARPSDLADTIKGILPAGSSVSADDSYNVMVIQTSSDYLPRLEKLIKELDIAPTQVMIEVQLIEVQFLDGGAIGVDAKYISPRDSNDTVQTANQASKPTADNTQQGLYAHILSGNVESYLSALKTSGIFNTIATPRITTISNREASLLIGQKLGYKTTITSATSTSQEIKFLEVGTALKITPQVTKSGFIRMSVSPKISDGKVIGDLPQENTTETKNEVMVRDGQTFVIGGLTREKDTEDNYGIPILMDIPLIGTFFRKTIVSKEKHDLLVFVTPRLLTPEILQTLGKPMIRDIQVKSDNAKAHLIH